jgi:hypothetical protein
MTARDDYPLAAFNVAYTHATDAMVEIKEMLDEIDQLRSALDETKPLIDWDAFDQWLDS